MRHAIVEMLCGYEYASDPKSVPSFCRWGPLREGFHCLRGTEKEPCPYLCYCHAPNELALSNSDGEIEQVEDFIALGGDMLEGETLFPSPSDVNIWNDVARKALRDAHDKYMVARSGRR